MSVWDKLATNAYVNQDPYPTKPSKPVLVRNPTSDEARAYADAIDYYEKVALPEFKAARAAYNVRTAELEAAFQQDLEAYYEMIEHPKASLLFGKSWDMGHSAGLHEVANVYSDLVELVK